MPDETREALSRMRQPSCPLITRSDLSFDKVAQLYTNPPENCYDRYACVNRAKTRTNLIGSFYLIILTDYRSVKGAELKNTMGRCRLPFPSLSPIPLAASPLVHYGRASSQAKRAITPRTKDLNGDPAHNMKQSSILILFVVCEVS